MDDPTHNAEHEAASAAKVVEDEAAKAIEAILMSDKERPIDPAIINRVKQRATERRRRKARTRAHSKCARASRKANRR
jgi:hypothetical protein